MRTKALDTAVSTALAAPARSLGPERGSLEAKLGADLGALRVHEGPAADRACDALGARGFALGRDVALSRTAAPDTLAHEAAHAVQQGMAETGPGTYRVAPGGDRAEAGAKAAANGGAPVARGLSPAIQRDLVSPDRLETVHQNVHVTGPPGTSSGGGGPPPQRQPWVDPSGSNGGTAATIENEVITGLQGSVLAPITAQTTQAELDQDAETANRRVLARFPQIPSPLSDAQIRQRTQFSTPASVSALPGFLDAWMDNFLPQLSSAGDYQIDFTNQHYRAMVTRLLNHPDVGPLLRGMASRQSAFTTGEGPDRQTFVHERMSDARRLTTLIHEYVHLYRSPQYRDWVATTRNKRVYNEGMTEWLARKVMTSAELTGRTDYQPRVDAVDTQIAPFVSEDDIARALFRGEVWRLETQSAEAREAFEAQTGIDESAPEADQRQASQTAPGLMQTVTPGERYRFFNLGFADPQPKPEHETAFRAIKAAEIDPHPARKLRFVGHASSPGTLEANRAMSRQRSVAFYRMARREGLPWNRLLDAGSPPHHGEVDPTVNEQDAITRAMNRRVEMFIVAGGTP